MPSPRVRNLVERCRRAQDAMAAHAPLIEELRRGDGPYTATLGAKRSRDLSRTPRSVPDGSQTGPRASRSVADRAHAG